MSDSKKQNKKFNIVITYDVTLTAEDVWPDGDGPESPTTDDVFDAMQAHSERWHEVIEDWNFDEPDVTVLECDTGK